MKLRASAVVRALWAVDFMLFLVMVKLSGGDALNGRVVGEQYYVGLHGHYYKTSHSLWLCNLFLELGWMILGFAAFVTKADERENRRG